MEQTPTPESQEPEEIVEPYTLAEPDKEEGEALTAELQAVLKKYDAEIGVTSRIHIYKRVRVAPKEEQAPTAPGPIPTPFPLNDGPDQDQGNQGGAFVPKA